MEISKELLKIPNKGSSEINSTFTLPESCLKDLDWLTEKLNLSNKKLFNSIWESHGESFIKIIKLIDYNQKNKRIIISQRISTKCRDNLKELSKKYGMKRDQIVELTLITYKMLYEKTISDNLKKHKTALGLVNDLWSFAEKIEKKSESILDKDDTILHRLGKIIAVIMNLSNAIQEEIENGVIIDPEDL